MGAKNMAIYVANHRFSDFPYGRPYVPLLVGAENDARLHDQKGRPLKTVCDDEGVQWRTDAFRRGTGLSKKNDRYCELTGLHWIWKRSPCHGIVGLMHYRRLLGTQDHNGQWEPLTAQQIAEDLRLHDCIVAKAECFKYPLSHDYALCHLLEDLYVVKTIIERGKRRYLDAFYRVMDGNVLHPYNIMVCRRRTLNAYCRWLFKVLAEAEDRIDLSIPRDPMQMRLFGFLAERLLNVWLAANEVDVAEHAVISPDEAVMEESHQRYEDIVAKEGYPGVDTCTLDLLQPLPDLSMRFDLGFYVRTYDDIWKTMGGNREVIFNHASTYGVEEGRMTSPFPGVQDYADMRPQLRKAFGDERERYQEAFKAEAASSRIMNREGVPGLVLSRNNRIE